MRLLDMVAKTEIKVTQKIGQEMVEHARAFMRCGQLNFTDWCEFAEHERRAFLIASEQINAERIISIVLALKNDNVLANLMAVADGTGEIGRLQAIQAALQAAPESSSPASGKPNATPTRTTSEANGAPVGPVKGLVSEPNRDFPEPTANHG